MFLDINNNNPDAFGSPQELARFLNKRGATPADKSPASNRNTNLLTAESFDQLPDETRRELLANGRNPIQDWDPDDSESKRAEEATKGPAQEQAASSQPQQPTYNNTALLAGLAHRTYSTLHNVEKAAEGFIARVRRNVIEDTADIRSEVDLIAHSIGYVETRNRYDLIGPRTRDGDHAYGYYQVMGKYVPEWTKKALGYSLTPEQFLKDPKAQDAVAHARMGDLYRRYGNVQDVAAVWFSGRPLHNNSSQDITGVSVPLYAQLAQQHHDQLLVAMGNRGTALAANTVSHPVPGRKAQPAPHVA